MAEEPRTRNTLHPFSPRWTDPDLAEKTLIGRRPLVDKLEQLAIEGAGGPNKYQRLIIGPRGTGKTHVLKVLHTRLMRNQALREKLLIVYLLEDELGVASFLDFLVRLLKAVQFWYSEIQEVARGLEELYDLAPAAQTRRAVELLLQAAGSRDLLILMENLGVTFDQKQGFGRKGQGAFRDMVQQYPRFMLFASAQALLDGVSESNAPFYEFFNVTYLRKLTLEEAVEFLTVVATEYGHPEVVKLLTTPEGRGRVRAIYDFTGGNHRLLVAFYAFLTIDSVSKLGEAFVDALQPLKPYYQEQMRSLSAQQQKIVQYLSLARTPKTVKEIARECLATSNTVSAQLKALLDKGFVERIPQGRESYYEITETLFRICYEADLDQQGAPIRLFVDFLGNFYTAQELDARARGFLLLARMADGGGPGHEEEAAIYRMALSRYHPEHPCSGLQDVTDIQEEWRSFFGELLGRAEYNEIFSFADRLGDSKDASLAMFEAVAYLRCENYGEACAVLRTAITKESEDSDLHALLGLAQYLGGDGEGAETSSRKALSITPTNPHALRVLARLLQDKGQVAQALDCQTALVDATDPANAPDLKLLGAQHLRLGNADEAEKILRHAIITDPSDAQTRLLLCGLLAKSGRFGEALEHVEAAVRLQPGDVECRWWAWAVLAQLGRLSDAEPHLRAALDIDGTDVSSLKALGNLLVKSGRAAEAIPYLERALSLNPNEPDLWMSTGSACLATRDLEKAEAGFRRAVGLRPDGDSISALAAVLVGSGRHSEAEPLLRGVMAREPDHTGARLCLARLLLETARPGEALPEILAVQKLIPDSGLIAYLAGSLAYKRGDRQQAERHLRRAVELDPTLTNAWVALAQVLSENGRFAEQRELLSSALDKADKGRILQALGDMESLAGDLVAAEADYLAVLQIQPDDASARFRLSTVLLKQGRLNEAIDQMKKGTEASDDSTLDEAIRLYLMAAFSSCTRPQMEIVLEPLMGQLAEHNRLNVLERALSLAVFGLLKRHKTTSEERFTDVSLALESVVDRHVDVSVALVFLGVGVEYLKRGDSKALMWLTREERALFTKELGIATL